MTTTLAIPKADTKPHPISENVICFFHTGVPDMTKARASVERLREPKNIFEDFNIAHFLACVNPQKSKSIAVSTAWPSATKARRAYPAPYGLRLRSLVKGINAGRPYDDQVYPALFIRSQPVMSFRLSAASWPEDIRQKVTRQIRGRPLTCPARSISTDLVRKCCAVIVRIRLKFQISQLSCGQVSCA